MSKRYVFWIALLLVLTLVTGYSWYFRIVYNLKMTALSQSSTSWGLWIAYYIFFVGLSAGAFLVSTLVYGFGLKRFEKIGRYALLAAILSLLGVFMSVLPDLGRMERFINLYITPNFGSWMAIEAWMYIIYITILICELYLVSRWDVIKLREISNGSLKSLYSLLSLGKRDYSEAEHKRDMKIVKVLALIGIPVAAIGVHGGTGAIFGVVGWRPVWFGAYTPIYFVLSALFSGAALVLALYIFTNRFQGKGIDPEAVDSLSRVIVLLGFVELFFIFWEVITNIWSTSPALEKTVLNIILFGPYWWVFWIMEILVGFVIPLSILLFKRPSSNPLLTALASGLMLIGVIGIRFNIILPTLAERPFPWMPMEWDIKMLPWDQMPAYVGGAFKWVINYSQGVPYFPTIWEWSLEFSIIFALILLYSIFVKILPMEVIE